MKRKSPEALRRVVREACWWLNIKRAVMTHAERDVATGWRGRKRLVLLREESIVLTIAKISNSSSNMYLEMTKNGGAEKRK